MLIRFAALVLVAAVGLGAAWVFTGDSSSASDAAFCRCSTTVTVTVTSTASTTTAGPPPVTNLVATALSQTSIQVSWTASPGATSYDLYKNGSLLTTTTGTSVVFGAGIPLSCGTAYTFGVAARNSTGISAIVSVSQTTFACPTTTTVATTTAPTTTTGTLRANIWLSP